jgi:Leucine-rich repeat (LRR) protein
MMKRLPIKICTFVLMALIGVTWAQANVTLNSANFPDANFRAALSTATGVAEGGTINVATLTQLDVSNKGITDLTGLELLTGLTSLNISDNSGLTTGANITGLTALVTLKAKNCNIYTLADTSSGNYAGLTIGTGNANLKYLDLSYNANFFTSGNLQYLTSLETLLLNNCTNYDYWGKDPGLNMTSLKWVDVSNCPLMDRIFLRGATQLQHLNAKGTKVTGFSINASTTQTTAGYIVLANNCPLKYLNLADCSQLTSFQAINNAYHVTTLDTLILANSTGINGWSPGITAQTGLKYCDLTNTGQTSTSVGFTSAFTSLETLILANNSAFEYSASLQYLSGLKYLDISYCDLFFREGSSPNYYLLHYLTPNNNPNLETLIASHSKLGTLTEGLTGFTKLKTVDVSNNTTSSTVKLTQFWVNGSPEIETLDISGNTGLTYLKLNNDNLPRNNFTLIGGETCTALNSLYLNDNKYASVAQSTSDFSGISALEFLYLENNEGLGGELTLNAADCGSLKGLDLGNNGITSFNAPSLPSTLTALMIGDNPAMTRLEMHNNPGITRMTASPTMSDGSGLYLLGNTALTYMDISGTAEQPNYFKHIGNNGSFYGVPIETLKASHNKFYSFRNLTQVPGGVYEHWGWKNWNAAHTEYTLINKYSVDNDEDTEQKWRYRAYWPTMAAMPDSASLEQLPNLKHLDLSYCNLKDSVYLHKNPELLYLDVSHNRTIYRSFDSSSSNPKYQKAAEFRSWISNPQHSSTSFTDYKKYMWLASNTDIREYYTNDCNDTTGLYILDLMDNNKLEYLDISYTGIEQTALTHCHVSNARYIWIQDLPNLKYFYADYNGMRSLGVGTQNGKKRDGLTTPTAGLKSLQRLSVIGMRGTDKTTMQGSINFRENSVCTQLHYINLGYSRYDSIGIYIPTVDTLILKGNPIHYVNAQKIDNITYLDASECAFKMRGLDIETGDIFFPDASVYKNGARIGGVYYENSTNIPAANPHNNGDLTTPFSGLRAIRAYQRNNLTTVLLDKSNALTEVFCFKDPELPKINGFDNLAFNQSYDAQYSFPTQDADSLRLVWVNDNPKFIELNLTKNDNLKYLHAYNDKALGTALGANGMNLTANTNLVTAWVSNSNLEKFTNCAVQQSTQAHLDTLKIWQNPILSELDVTKYNNLRYLDLRNCMVRNLDMSNNPQLTYFDCSNRDSTWVGQAETYSRFTYDYNMPRSVATIVDDPGKNTIADLQFSSNNLRVVRADNNDLYTLRGLSNNPNLEKLTYSFNHINAIDLSGCPNISEYNCFHNVRGRILSELSVWSTTENNVTTEHKMYYLQLKPNAGDALDPEHHDTYLGHKWGEDSLLSNQDDGFIRRFVDDDFDPTKVISFTTNAAGPYHGTRGENAAGAPLRVTEIIDPSVELDPSKIYGEVVVIKYFNNDRNYVEYLYDDGRPNSGNRDGGGSAFGIAWGPPGEATLVEETTADGMGQPTVVSERYFDTAGAEHNEPVDGVNIVVRQMSDGSSQTVKIVR